MSDREAMEYALAEAGKAAQKGETPVGAVMVRNGEIIAAAHNLRETGKDATAHAELLCIRQACRRLGGWRLPDCTLYVTLEPCPMCAGAILNARIPRVVFGAYDSRAGSFGSVVDLSFYPYNHRPQLLGGVLAAESEALLRTFFETLRRERRSDGSSVT